MNTTKRATVYLDPDVHRALRLKAAAADRSISDMVNAALKQALAEDAIDLETFQKRRGESSIDFETFVKALHRRGKL
ncbi:MAG: CopG family transcriptional regulator [Acidobacteria bacterium]|nr:CopG family transcriptional regulator [Acidobacteriota bacterium]MCI0622201.1 CopG family transcriptional regulator [Acidobacteriota bacterium]MCI0718289.1 CopG family transcriptional regulator [Acidobacteriota bacterium]